MDRWIEHITGLGRSATTLYHYRQFVDREIVPVLGAIRLSKLSTLEIDALYTKLRKRGLARNDPPDPCHPACITQSGRAQGLIQRNIAKLASAPAQPQREQHPPSIAEVRSLMTAAIALDPLFGLFIRVMVATGARRVEVCGLRWSDVAFEAGTLDVSRSTPCSQDPGAIRRRNRG